MIIIVTGNIGCGKSTVVKELTKRLPHYQVYDIDMMVHELYENTEFKEFLQRTFQTTDRRIISDFVFPNPRAKKLLEDESIRYLGRQVEELYTRDNIILEYPLYFEMGEHKRPNQMVICVSCDKETQVRRVKARNNFTDEKIAAIMASQLPTYEKEGMSDAVIDNNDGADVDSQLTELATKL